MIGVKQVYSRIYVVVNHVENDPNPRPHHHFSNVLIPKSIWGSCSSFAEDFTHFWESFLHTTQGDECNENPLDFQPGHHDTPINYLLPNLSIFANCQFSKAKMFPFQYKIVFLEITRSTKFSHWCRKCSYSKSPMHFLSSLDRKSVQLSGWKNVISCQIPPAQDDHMNFLVFWAICCFLRCSRLGRNRGFPKILFPIQIFCVNSDASWEKKTGSSLPRLTMLQNATSQNWLDALQPWKIKAHFCIKVVSFNPFSWFLPAFFSENCTKFCCNIFQQLPHLDIHAFQNEILFFVPHLLRATSSITMSKKQTTIFRSKDTQNFISLNYFKRENVK